jgi:hypothetical protein
MRSIYTFITEKLKVSTDVPEYLISIEEIASMLKDYCKRHGYDEYELRTDDILGEIPKVLEYTGDFTTENIVGKDIKVIGYYKSPISKKEFLYIDFDYYQNGIEVQTTKDLYEIFGEDNVDKLYKYLQK